MVEKSSGNLLGSKAPDGSKITLDEFSQLLEPKSIQIVIVKYDKKFFGDSVSIMNY